MGIRGLMTFMDTSHMLKPHKLHDTRVIFDGNNLYNYIFFKYCIPQVYGGDYDVYEEKIRQYFKVLESCKITPYVVFDGGQPPHSQKLGKYLKKAQKQIYVAYLIGTGRHGKLVPILAGETFRAVLRELGVSYVAGDFEADHQIALLAQQWDCPIISNDSDFFIFNMGGGFIPLGSISLEVGVEHDESAGTKYSYLNSEIYFFDYLADKFTGLKQSMMPLFATVMGNDYVQHCHFNAFMEIIKLPKKMLIKHVAMPDIHNEMLALFIWLAKQQSIDEAIEAILQCCMKRKFTVKLIRDSINIYTNISCSFQMSKFLETGILDVINTGTCYNGTAFPDWFMKEVKSATFPSFVLDACRIHRIISRCQVEDLKLPSSYRCSLNIRKFIYGLLLKEDLVTDEHSSKISSCIEEYDRVAHKVHKCFIQPSMKIHSVGLFPGLSTISDLSPSNRLHILLCALNVEKDIVTDLPVDLELTLCIIIFWVKCANPPPTEDHVQSLLVCIIYLHAKSLRGKSMPDHNALEETVNNIFLQTTPEHCQKLIENLDPYCIVQTNEQKVCFDLSIIHGFAQFQSCFKDCSCLNQLLLSPLKYQNIYKIFSGTFVYNFCRHLIRRFNPQPFIQEKLVPESRYYYFYCKMKQLIDSKVRPLYSERNFKKTRPKSKKKRRSKSKMNIEVEEASESEDKSETSETPIVMCEMANKFSMLDCDSS